MLAAGITIGVMTSRTTGTTARAGDTRGTGTVATELADALSAAILEVAAIAGVIRLSSGTAAVGIAEATIVVATAGSNDSDVAGVKFVTVGRGAT